MKTSAIVILAFGATFFTASEAEAQCCGFGRIRPGLPDAIVADGFQKAMIYHVNGVQRIVLQPSYKGVAKDFGVFLAVPEIPLIEKADAKLFQEIERLLMPPPPARARSSAKMAPRAAAAESWQGVSVIKTELVGMYEASVLQASDRNSFTDWLEKNDYKWEKRLEPVFDHYVKEKWFFVAMKVNRNVNKATRFSGPVQPISVRFVREKTIMPMKLTSLTPGGVDFRYYLVTDSQKRGLGPLKGKAKRHLQIRSTAYQRGSAPTLKKMIEEDVFLTPQQDLKKVLSRSDQRSFRDAVLPELWLAKFEGHFNENDLGDDFEWESVQPFGGPPDDAKVSKNVLKEFEKGMRKVESVKLIADVFDTNEGYGKPTFINGIHIGDLAAVGGEGSDRWQTITIELPKSVAHWLNEKIRIKVENYGKARADGKRFVDAYNLRNVKIVVAYDDESTWESKRFKGTKCSVPKWKNCQGTKVKRWGDPLIINF